VVTVALSRIPSNPGGKLRRKRPAFKKETICCDIELRGKRTGTSSTIHYFLLIEQHRNNTNTNPRQRRPPELRKRDAPTEQRTLTRNSDEDGRKLISSWFNESRRRVDLIHEYPRRFTNQLKCALVCCVIRIHALIFNWWLPPPTTPVACTCPLPTSHALDQPDISLFVASANPIVEKRGFFAEIG